MRNSEEKPNVFDDLDRFRIEPGDAGLAGIQREVDVCIRIRRPTGRDWVRVHPGPEMSLTTTVIIDKDGMQPDFYLVPQAMREPLAGDVRPVLLVTAITRQNVVMIWPVMLPLDGRVNLWHERARTAAERAKHRWVRLVADMALGTYRIYEAIGDWPEPEWPNMSLSKLLELAFAGRVIEGEDHPQVRYLRGAA